MKEAPADGFRLGLGQQRTAPEEEQPANLAYAGLARLAIRETLRDSICCAFSPKSRINSRETQI